MPKPIPGVLDTLKIDEISAVDVPAQEGAKSVIMKRHETGDDRFRVDKRQALTSETNGHTHLFYVDAENGELNAGQTSYDNDHSHPWVRTEDGSIVIGAAQGHTHTVASVGKAKMSDDIEDMDDEDDDMKKAANPGGTPASESKGGPMSISDEMQAAIEKAVKEATEAQSAELATAKAFGELSDAEKFHYNDLDDDGKTEFLAKSVEERREIVRAAAKKAEDENPVVYKAADGTEYRKSDDARLAALAKQADEDRAARLEAEKSASDAVLEKRAEDEIPHLPGTVEERAALLKAVDQIEDEAQRAASLKALKAQNEQMSKAFQTYGVQGGGGEEGTANGDLNALAKSYQKDHPDTTFQQAYAEVLKTPEGRKLYAQTRN